MLIFRKAVVLFALVALLCAPLAAARSCAAAQPPVAACKACCLPDGCCAAGPRHAPVPAQPLSHAGARGAAELLAAIAPGLTALLYTFPVGERHFAAPRISARGYVAEPFAVGCIRLI